MQTVCSDHTHCTCKAKNFLDYTQLLTPTPSSAIITGLTLVSLLQHRLPRKLLSGLDLLFKSRVVYNRFTSSLLASSVFSLL
jgi:hypothetical protein